MLASILIIGFSLVLLVYWFRYSCILLLRSFSEQQVLAKGIEDDRFSLAEVQGRLKTDSQLDPASMAVDGW